MVASSPQFSISSMGSDTLANRAKGPCQNGLKGPSSRNKRHTVARLASLAIVLHVREDGGGKLSG
jgi:hypothetical protein